LAHAVIDAVLGAWPKATLGPFPDSDPQWKDANSFKMLAHVMRLAQKRGFHAVNADATVMLERPKLREHIDQMRENLAEALRLDVTSVSVKAKTAKDLMRGPRRSRQCAGNRIAVRLNEVLRPQDIISQKTRRRRIVARRNRVLRQGRHQRRSRGIIRFPRG
jgi:2-C-methyl-D-erythritol 2,4-cyclodiphosphate synthase